MEIKRDPNVLTKLRNEILQDFYDGESRELLLEILQIGCKQVFDEECLPTITRTPNKVIASGTHHKVEIGTVYDRKYDRNSDGKKVQAKVYDKDNIERFRISVGDSKNSSIGRYVTIPISIKVMAKDGSVVASKMSTIPYSEPIEIEKMRIAVCTPDEVREYCSTKTGNTPLDIRTAKKHETVVKSEDMGTLNIEDCFKPEVLISLFEAISLKKDKK